MATQELIQIENLKANLLPELQGWKEKQECLVEENQFVAITDNKTYEVAKKCRTALLKGRTEIEKSEKLIASKIKEFRSDVSIASKELISITLPHETKQQEEVKRYEELKIQEKAEKERIEAERKKTIQNNISVIFEEWKDAINKLTFEDIDGFLMVDVLNDADTEKFEEFAIDFNEKVQTLTMLYDAKVEQLNTEENLRVEAEKLIVEREEFEKEKSERQEKERIEALKIKEAQDKIDAEQKAKSDELAKQEAKILEEKNRIEKKELERIAKEKAEKEAIEESKRIESEKLALKKREEEEQKRLLELAPDKEKVQSFISSLTFNSPTPNVNNKELREFLEGVFHDVESLKEVLIKNLNQIK